MTPEEFDALDKQAKLAVRAGLSDLGKAACDYCELGWSVLPLVPGGKQPIDGSGANESCDDWETVCWFWLENPDCNVGIATGEASNGLLVIDVDQNEDAGKYGEEVLFEWEKANGKLPETVCATSGSGGHHYYFRTTSKVKCASNRTLAIDRRGDGGYVVAPPSVHPDGGRYEWDLDPQDYDVAFADNKVIELMAFCDGGDASSKTGDGRFVFPDVVHDGEGREQNLVSLAFSLRSQGMDYDAILSTLSQVNDERVVPPKPPKDIRRIAKSVCRKPAGLSPEYAAAKERAELRAQQQAELAAQEYEERMRAAAEANIAGSTEHAPINPDDFKIGKSGLDHAAVGKDMLKRFHFCMVDGVPVTWTGARYEVGWDRAVSVLSQYKRTIRESERREVCRWLEIYAPNVQQAPWQLIAFKNGVLNVKTMESQRRCIDMVIPNVIPHDWNPDASSELVDKFLDGVACGRPDVVANLCEVIGLCMCRGCFMDKAFFLINSTGCNGKSTYINFLRSILGEDNCSSVDPQLMSQRFQTVPLMGKLANIADDIPSSIADSDGLAVFKKAVSGDVVPLEFKGGKATDFRPYSTFVFSMNRVPPLGDSTGGMMRRIHPVPFDANFRGVKADRFLGEKLSSEECCEAAIVLGVQALRRMLETGEVTETEFSKREVEDIELTNNQVKLFLEEREWTMESLEFMPTKQLFDSYTDWADESCIRNVFSRKRFLNEVKALTKLNVVKTRIGIGGQAYKFVPQDWIPGTDPRQE